MYFRNAATWQSLADWTAETQRRLAAGFRLNGWTAIYRAVLVPVQLCNEIGKNCMAQTDLYILNNILIIIIIIIIIINIYELLDLSVRQLASFSSVDTVDFFIFSSFQNGYRGAELISPAFRLHFYKNKMSVVIFYF